MVSEAIKKSGKEIIGFVASDKPTGTVFCNLEDLGDEQVLSKYSPESILLANGVGAIPHQDQRWKLASRLREKGYVFLKIIHRMAQ